MLSSVSPFLEVSSTQPIEELLSLQSKLERLFELNSILFTPNPAPQFTFKHDNEFDELLHTNEKVGVVYVWLHCNLIFQEWHSAAKQQLEELWFVFENIMLQYCEQHLLPQLGKMDLSNK